MMKEIWKDIKGYEGLYQVSNFGRIKRLAYSREISPRGYKQIIHRKEKILRLNNRHYKLVVLSKDGVSVTKTVHRLVAEAFIPNPKNLPCVNHKDENKYNNYVENLEWCTVKYNSTYGEGFKKRKETQRRLYGKCIDQYDLDGHLIDTLETAHSKEPEFSATKIIMCCKRKSLQYKGFIWTYHNEKPNLKVNKKSVYGVSVIDPTDIVYFKSIAEAGRAGYNTSSIYQNLKHNPRYSHCGNRIWYRG